VAEPRKKRKKNHKLYDEVAAARCLHCHEYFCIIIDKNAVQRLVCPFCYQVTVINKKTHELMSG